VHIVDDDNFVGFPVPLRRAAKPTQRLQIPESGITASAPRPDMVEVKLPSPSTVKAAPTIKSEYQSLRFLGGSSFPRRF
jgi:hypothetical protein